MVERLSRLGKAIGPDEAIGVAEGLRAYTMGSAEACRVEDRLGSITAGKHADFVVLAADPTEVPTANLATIPVTATAVAGRLVYTGTGRRHASRGVRAKRHSDSWESVSLWHKEAPGIPGSRADRARCTGLSRSTGGGSTRCRSSWC
ncbi:MAG: amidohydrolase family protein [Jatrophihabitans sp.]